jgi:peptidoglycan/LPS O-acetylase OafA/YrhL
VSEPSQREIQITNPLYLRGFHPRLDSLRTIAALAVIAVHSREDGGLSTSKYMIDSSLAFILEHGRFGVDLFLVISGYLITSILLGMEGQTGGLKRFWIRRALRIFPLFFLYLIISSMVFWMAGALKELWVGPPLWQYFVFANNIGVYTHGETHRVFKHLWSIALEEQFYIIWSVLFLGTAWFPSLRKLAWIALASLVGAILFRGWVAGTYGIHPGFFLQLPLRLDGLAMGVLLAVAARYDRVAFILCNPRCYFGLMVLGVGLFFYRPPFAFGQWWVMAIIFGLQSFAVSLFCTGLVLSVLANSRTTFWASWKPFQFLGKVSYGIYMWHLLAILAVNLVFPAPPVGIRAGYYLVYYLAILAVTMVFTMISWKIVEEPLLNLKDKLAPNPKRPHHGTAAAISTSPQ